MVLNLCVHMPCFELIEFFRSFANVLNNIAFEDAELIQTSSNKQFISFKSLKQDTIDVSYIPDCQLQKKEIVHRVKISSVYFKNWHFDQESTKKAIQFAILTKDSTAVLKLLCQSLEIDKLAETQTIKLQNNSDLLVLNNITFFDFEVVSRHINNIELKTYFFHKEHKTFYPLYLSKKSNRSTKTLNVIDFPKTSLKLASNSLDYILPDSNVDSKYLRNRLINTKIEKHYSLTKSFENNESNQIASVIECKHNDLTKIIDSLTKLIEPNNKVLVIEHNNNFHIVLMNTKISVQNSQVYNLLKQKHFIQQKTRPFPLEIKDDNTHSYSDSSFYILLPTKKESYFNDFQLLKLDNEKATDINNFIRYKTNFIFSELDSQVSNISRSKSFNYCDLISFDEYEPVESAEVDATQNDLNITEVTKIPQVEYIDSYSSGISFSDLAQTDENIRNEIKTLDFQEIQSKEQQLYNKLQTTSFEDSQSEDFIGLWEDIIDLVFVYLDTKLIDIHTRSEVLINLITQLYWYDLTNLFNSSFSDKINSFYRKHDLQDDMIMILHKSLLHVLHMKLPVDNARTYDLYNISKELIDFKLRTLYLEILADSNCDNVFISRELEEIICMLNLRKCYDIDNFSLYNLISTVLPANWNFNNNETKPEDFLSRLSDLHKHLIATDSIDHSDNVSLSIISLASKFPNLLDYIFAETSNESNNQFIIFLKSLLIAIHDDGLSDKQLSAILQFIASKMENDKNCSKMLFIVLNILDSKSSHFIPIILKEIDAASIPLLACYPDLWMHLLGDELFLDTVNNSIDSLINSETKYLTDTQIRNLITLLDTIAEMQFLSTQKEAYSFANEKLLEIWNKKKVSQSQFICILNTKFLDLSNLYVTRIANRKTTKTHFVTWKDSTDTQEYKLQTQYAKYLCNINKIDDAFNLIAKVLTHLSYLVDNRTLNTVNYPLHKLIADLINVLPLTGKFSKVNEVLARVEELIKQNNYFGRSIFSVERIEIYVAFINCYASFSMNKEAESQLISLLEKILPAHHSASNEHLLFVFQKLWKSIIINLPHLTPKIISVFEKIFTNADADNEYSTIFNIYKQYHQFSYSSDKIPTINLLKNNQDSFSFDSEFVLFKTWLEVAEDVAILEKVNVIDFIEIAYQQILLTNSGIKGFNELCEFLNKNIEPNREISREEERIINREITEIKERITQIYGNLVK